MTSRELWDRYRSWLYDNPGLAFRLDLSRMNLPDDYAESEAQRMNAAFASMAELEGGAIANPDEQRMVGHYWLRAPELAPRAELREDIESAVAQVTEFARRVHEGEIHAPGGERFRNLLVIGIGGSALGPQFVAAALGSGTDPMTPYFLDNTDPDGIDRVLEPLGPELGRTLAVVISKSGGTPETRNGMLETAAAYGARGLEFGPHAVAITQDGSKLDRVAVEQSFLARFPMWDWVGGRTSELSTVGLLPAALQGLDIQAMLRGAKEMDAATRLPRVRENPAALLALAWYHAGEGRGARDMVILPYKDRLALFSRYLQQLVMESLGKQKDLDGRIVNQGIAVYGNKGSTDQHAYVQQLREGVPNFFATFIEVLRDREGESMEVDAGVTAGDYLQGFLLGTRRALHENGRPSLTITVERVDARCVGMLIALFERAVGLYASMIGINAYHQPGVEAGKQAAAAILDLQRGVVSALHGHGAEGATCEQLAQKAGAGDEVETVFQLLERLAANPERGVRKTAGSGPFDARYATVSSRSTLGDADHE